MNNSNLNSNCKYSEHESDIGKTVKLVSCLVFGAFGISGNVFVIVLALKYTVTKSLHFLIINMAVSDSLYVVLHVFRYVNNKFITTSIWNDIDWNIATVLCKLLNAHYICTNASLVSLLIISIERYKVTRKNVQISRPLSGKRRAIVIACCWLVPIVMQVDTFIYAYIDKTDSKYICIRHYTYKNKAIIYAFAYIAFWLILYSIIAFLSISILRKLSKPQVIENSLSEDQRQHRRHRIRNAVKMILYSLLLYSCCYLPFVTGHIIALSINRCVYYKWQTVFFLAWYILPIVNSSISPCIYCVCLSDFREAAKRLLCFGRTHPRLERRNSIVPSSRSIENTQM